MLLAHFIVVFRTRMSRWSKLSCAVYIQKVTFHEPCITRLSSLFYFPYNKRFSIHHLFASTMLHLYYYTLILRPYYLRSMFAFYIKTSCTSVPHFVISLCVSSLALTQDKPHCIQHIIIDLWLLKNDCTPANIAHTHAHTMTHTHTHTHTNVPTH